MVLTGVDQYNLEVYQELLNITLFTSNYFDFMDVGSIAYKITPRSQPLFTYFQCFSPDLWLFIFALIIVISSIISFNEENMSKLSENIFNVFIILISKSIPNSMKMNNKLNKLLIGFWLLLVMFLSIMFSSFLLDYMIKPIPNEVIDSWDDLYMRSEVTILAPMNNAIVKYSELENTSMAKSFRSRIDSFLPEDSKEWFDYMYKKMDTGHYALVVKKWNLLFLLSKMSNNNKEWIKTFHISSNGGLKLPNYLPVLTKMDKNILQFLNKL